MVINFFKKVKGLKHILILIELCANELFLKKEKEDYLFRFRGPKKFCGNFPRKKTARSSFKAKKTLRSRIKEGQRYVGPKRLVNGLRLSSFPPARTAAAAEDPGGRKAAQTPLDQGGKNLKKPDKGRMAATLSALSGAGVLAAKRAGGGDLRESDAAANPAGFSRNPGKSGNGRPCTR